MYRQDSLSQGVWIYTVSYIHKGMGESQLNFWRQILLQKTNEF